MVGIVGVLSCSLMDSKSDPAHHTKLSWMDTEWSFGKFVHYQKEIDLKKLASF